MKEKLELSVVSEDVLRTFGFFTKNRKYNNAADTRECLSWSDSQRINSYGMQLSSTEIAKLTGFTKLKTLRIVETLKEKDYVRVLGKGRGTKYSL